MIGSTIGRHRALKKLGEGAIGVVSRTIDGIEVADGNDIVFVTPRA